MPNMKRLERALKGLQEIRRDETAVRKFNLASWGVLPAEEKDRKQTPDLTCATAACAVGSLILRGDMPGMKYNIWSNGYIWPRYSGREDFSAVASYFGVPLAVSEYLFSPDNFGGVTVGKTGLSAVIRRLSGTLSIYAPRVSKKSRRLFVGKVLRSRHRSRECWKESVDRFSRALGV